MDRFVLTDAHWAKMEPHCLGKATDPGRTGSDGRMFLEAVLWIARTGSPWRDLPETALRANDGETSEPLKFSLAGEGQSSWSCNAKTSRRRQAPRRH